MAVIILLTFIFHLDRLILPVLDHNLVPILVLLDLLGLDALGSVLLDLALQKPIAQTLDPVRVVLAVPRLGSFETTGFGLSLVSE
jgi:hypothetical protein